MVAEKACRKCGQVLPLLDFYKDARAPDGRYARCKRCHCGDCTKWAKSHPEEVAAITARYASNNPDAARDAARRHDAKRRIQRNAERRLDNERQRNRLTLWRRRNPGRQAAQQQKRRCLKANAGGNFSSADVMLIRHLQRDRCAICRAKLGADISIDHITPLALGGKNDRSNIQIAHRGCNSSKGAKDPLIFNRQLGRLL